MGIQDHSSLAARDGVWIEIHWIGERPALVEPDASVDQVFRLHRQKPPKAPSSVGLTLKEVGRCNLERCCEAAERPYGRVARAALQVAQVGAFHARLVRQSLL